MNHGEKRVNLERLTQTKLLCKSSLGSLVRKKTPIWEKLQNGQIYRGMTKKKKKSQTVIFFSSEFSPALRSLSVTSKWVFTQVRWTQNSRDRKRWREQRAETSRSWQLLYAKFFLRETMWRFCYCCYSLSISTTFLLLSEIHQDKVATVAGANRAASSKTKSHFPCDTHLLVCSIFLS